MKPKNIGLFHYIAGFTDGVSLEMNKWKFVLESMGHTVHFCAGKFGTAEGTVIDEMYHHSPDAHLLNTNTFGALRDYPDEITYRAELFRIAGIIEGKIRDFIEKKQIDFLLPQNVWSVAMNPAVAIALTNIMREFRIPTLAQSHDFYFERTGGIALTCGTAIELADHYLPPRDELITHVVINSLAQDQLLKRKGISSFVVPNIFDFDAPPWKIDNYNRDLRVKMGLRETDLLILQATRIVPRKGIELAIDFVKALSAPGRRAQLKRRGLFDGRKFDDDSRIVLVLAGYALDDMTGRYKNLLAHKADKLNVEVIFIEDMIRESRKNSNGKKYYSLWDTYAHADFVTYPSLWEGWGNQLLEALRAKKPLMLFEYPVFEADIKQNGLRVVSLGNSLLERDEYGLATVDSEIIETAADQALEILIDAKLHHRTVEHNFQVGKENYSVNVLHKHLRSLFTGQG